MATFQHCRVQHWYIYLIALYCIIDIYEACFRVVIGTSKDFTQRSKLSCHFRDLCHPNRLSVMIFAFLGHCEFGRSPVGSSTVSSAPPRALGRQRRDDVLRYDNHNADTIHWHAGQPPAWYWDLLLSLPGHWSGSTDHFTFAIIITVSHIRNETHFVSKLWSNHRPEDKCDQASCLAF